MSDPGPVTATYYRPAEVAAMLRCSEWWLKEQARRRRIPYSWIGGSYLFTQAHIEQIVRLFEVQAIEVADPVPLKKGRGPRSAQNDDNEGDEAPVRLRARPPRRARGAAASTTPAA